MVARLLAVLPVALLALAASCGGGRDAGLSNPVEPVDGVLTVSAFEFGYQPDNIVLSQGDQVRIVLTNEGGALHNLKVDDIAVDVIESQSTGPLEGDEGELFVGADSGDEGSIIFVPREAGVFDFYCSIPNHRSLGMEGRLEVR